MWQWSSVKFSHVLVNRITYEIEGITFNSTPSGIMGSAKPRNSYGFELITFYFTVQVEWYSMNIC
jgi:hypothetical protein